MVLESEIPNTYTFNDQLQLIQTDVGFHIEFDISAALSAQPTTIHFNSFNPSIEQIKFSQQEGASLVVYAGYLGIPDPAPVEALTPKSGFYNSSQINLLLSDHLTGLSNAFPNMQVKPIFEGSIIQARKLLVNTVDSLLNIVAVDSDVQITSAFTNVSVKSGQTNSKIMEAITSNALNDLKLRTSNITEMPILLNYNEIPNKLHRGKTIVGPYYDALRAFGANNEADVYFEKGSAVVLGRDVVDPNTSIIYLSPSSGLIGLPIQTFNGINVRSVLNASLIRGGSIRLDNSLIQIQEVGTQIGAQKDYEFNVTPILDGALGIYKILAVNHVGDTRGSDWYTDLICYSYDTPPPSSIGRYSPF